MGKIFDAIQNSLLALHFEAGRYHARKNTGALKTVGVFYGRSPSLSSFIEEKFAQELSKVYPLYKILVDYPIRLCNEDEEPIISQNHYPDIMILDNKNNLKAIIELKLDIGHLDIDKFKCSKRDGCFDKAKCGFINSVVGRYSKQQIKNERNKIKVDRHKKILIVFTLINEHNHKGKPKSEIFKKELLKKGYIPLFLLEKTHYNYFDNVSEKIKDELKTKVQEINNAFKGI